VLGRRRKGSTERLDELLEQLEGLELRREHGLLELGDLALEMHREERLDTDLLIERAAELASLQREIDALESEALALG